MMDNFSTSQLWALAAWLSVAFVAAGIGAVASVNAAAFYAGLNRPSWAPPAWLFGPVWTLLYLLMGISVWLVWRQTGFTRWLPFCVFFLQLGFNALWSWLFFYWHAGALAFVEILLLWLLILANILVFWEIVPVAALLLVPYMGWVSFAGLLAWTVWRANPDVL